MQLAIDSLATSWPPRNLRGGRDVPNRKRRSKRRLNVYLRAPLRLHVVKIFRTRTTPRSGLPSGAFGPASLVVLGFALRTVPVAIDKGRVSIRIETQSTKHIDHHRDVWPFAVFVPLPSREPRALASLSLFVRTSESCLGWIWINGEGQGSGEQHDALMNGLRNLVGPVSTSDTLVSCTCSACKLPLL
jgi:hypothetical protein